MRRLGVALLMFAAACGGEEDVVTGGFDETIIDKRINGGVGMQVVDVDGDGANEVIAAFTGTRAVHVYARPPELTEPWERIAISGLASIVAVDLDVADLDGDGDLDVVALSSGPPLGEPERGALTWYENPGTLRGIWKTRPITGATIEGGVTVAAGDIDGDGRVDLVVGTQPTLIDTEMVGGDVHWYRNDGASFEGPYPVAPNAVGVSRVIVVDLDGDAATDVLAAGGTTGVLFMRNTSTATAVGRFTRYAVSADIGFDAITLANVDGDAALELVAAQTLPPFEGAATGTVSVHVFDRPAQLGDPWPMRTIVDNVISDGTSPTGPVLTTGDFDGDGAVDVAVATNMPGDLRIYSNAGTTAWGLTEIRGGYVGIQRLASDDVDGDGRLDLLTNTSNFATRDRIAWWRNVGP